MGYHTARTLPTYDRLAREYAVCHRWFASVPGPTWPNRFFGYCGHSGGIFKNLQILDAPTIFDHVERAGRTWACYSHDISFLRAVHRFTAARDPFQKIGAFYAACQKGELPDVSWIDPAFTLAESPWASGYTNDDHPPADVLRGQALVARIYNALLFAPGELFWRTLLVIVYDEHGGFYDHFPPPGAPPPFGDARFARYGVRVPALVISPWIPRGYVSDEVFDHASIVRTIRNRFCPDLKYGAMGARVDAANDLSTLLQLQSPRKAAELPVAPAIPVDDQSHVPPAATAYQHTELQNEMAELRRIALAQGAPADVL
jgi:phospholipase C